MERTHVQKNLLAFLLTTFLALLIFALPAYATPSSRCTPTDCNLKGSFDFGPVGPNPCTGVEGIGDLFIVGSLTTHASADLSHFTFTVTGSFTFTEVDGTVYTGHFTAWDGGNFNPATRHAEASGTFAAHATGTDGVRVQFNGNNHMTILPDGTVTASHSNMNLRCS